MTCKHRSGENLQAKKTTLPCILKKGSYKQRLMQTLLQSWEAELLSGEGRCCSGASRETKTDKIHVVGWEFVAVVITLCLGVRAHLA